MIARVLMTLFLLWCLMVGGHMLREIWVIVCRGVDALVPCRRWWCPEGIRNRLKG